MNYRLDIINISRPSIYINYIINIFYLSNSSIPVNMSTSLGKGLVISVISGSPGISQLDITHPVIISVSYSSGQSPFIDIFYSPGIGQSTVTSLISTSSYTVIDISSSSTIFDSPLTGRVLSKSLNRLFFWIRFSKETGPSSKYLSNCVIVKSFVSHASY